MPSLCLCNLSLFAGRDTGYIRQRIMTCLVMGLIIGSIFFGLGLDECEPDKASIPLRRAKDWLKVKINSVESDSNWLAYLIGYCHEGSRVVLIRSYKV